MNGDDVQTAINTALVEKWPARKVYLTLLPKELERPAFYLYMVKESAVSAMRYVERVTAQYAVEIVEEDDEYGQMDFDALRSTMAAVKVLFPNGKVKVDDRYLNISAASGGPDDAINVVNFTLDYFRETAEAQKEYPVAGTVTTTIRTEE